MATYIDLLNAFQRLTRAHYLSGHARLLYYGLLEVFNEAHWPERVQVDNFRAMSMIDTRTEKTVISARDELVHAGLIAYEKGRKKQPNAYVLKHLGSENDSVSGSESDSVSGSENDSVSDSESDSVSGSVSASENDSENDSVSGSVSDRENDSHIKTKKKSKTKTKTKSKTIEDEEENVICAELPGRSSTPAITLPLNDGTEYPVTVEQCHEWAGLYPAVDVIQQLRQMRGWLNANPNRRKTRRGINAFVVNWLSREQDKGRRVAPNPGNRGSGNVFLDILREEEMANGA